MRTLLLTALAVLLAGCSGQQGTPDPAPFAPSGPAAAPLPPPIHANGTMPPSLDPVASGGPACSPPGSTCFRYPFRLEGNATADARLSWSLDANDLDLYLMQGSQALDSSNRGMTTSESLSAQLPAGDYEFVVQGSTTTLQDFRFDATFGPPRPEGPGDSAAPNP